ncbi:putative tyrosine-protein phosphatase [Staphylotrichum tortipilum]|uniref:diphosphoinositol-polyphosphate diphosphatase n=1 Tax=Staphylotrichum tortipilum TaxID=2831512 RepID=A0AAN6RQB4_9PEZI|nr:putative tyrosine-protein phosphatase [Staphylotrichum longicolle]
MSLVKQTSVSKRNSRPFVESHMEKSVEMPQEKRAVRQEEVGSEANGKASSTATSATQSSQASPVVRPIEGEQEADLLRLSSLRLFPTGPWDPFYPQSLRSPWARSTAEHERSLPAKGRPANFGVVVPGVYRSSFPQSEDYGFIEALKLKTIVTLVQKDFPDDYHGFINGNGINHAVFDMKGTKKEEIPVSTMQSILRVVLDRQNHPLLIHCNHGKHRTGCVVGVVRKLSGWDLNDVIDEYRVFAEPKVRDCDVAYLRGCEAAHFSGLFRQPSLPFRTVRFLRAAVFSLVMLVMWATTGPWLVGDKLMGLTESELRSEE